MGVLLRNAGAPGQLASGAPSWTAEEAIETLGPLLSESRRQRIADVVRERTYTVATVIEGTVNTGNVSAVMRTAEALGFQSFHVIRGESPYKHSVRTTQGAQKWLDVSIWDSAIDCARRLKDEGYEIVVTHLGPDAVPLQVIDFTCKTAVVFGNELKGASDEILELADRTVIIPSTGFVRSFNISVAAAMVLHKANLDRENALGTNGDLTDDEQRALTAEFYFRAVNHAEDILEKAKSSS